MIGNDIVDLLKASNDSNWQRPRFLDKVFTEAEQQMILNAKDQSQMVWLLWSMKEAAYKVYVQQFGKRFFNPKRLVCKLYPKNKGTVNVEFVKYKTYSLIDKNFIHSIAYTTENKDLKTKCFNIETHSHESQSNLTKKQVLKYFSKIKNVSEDVLSIQKNELGIPHLFEDRLKLDERLSISHHGRYCAYAIL